MPRNVCAWLLIFNGWFCVGYGNILLVFFVFVLIVVILLFLQPFPRTEIPPTLFDGNFFVGLHIFFSSYHSG